MSDIFSTRDLSTGADTGHETLESFIINTSRKKERQRRKEQGKVATETNTSVRLERWQENEIDSIRKKLSTSSSNVVNRAYVYGLEEIRDELPEIEEIATIGGTIQDVIKNDLTDEERYSTFYKRYKEIECDVNTKPQGDVSTDPTHVSVFGSILQEVTDTFNRDLHLDGSSHRLIIGVGLHNSKEIGRAPEMYSQRMLDSLGEGIEEYHSMLESFVDRYTRWSMQDWREQGIDKRTYQELKNITQLMDSEYKDTVQNRLEKIEDFVEGVE